MSMVFCDQELHRDGCCPAAADYLPARTDSWLDGNEKAVRQPTGEEMHLFLRRKIGVLPLDEVTKKRVTSLLDDYLPLVDAEWWDDRSVHEEDLDGEQE